MTEATQGWGAMAERWADGESPAVTVGLAATNAAAASDAPRQTDPAYLRAVVDLRLSLLVPRGPAAPRLSSAMRYALLAPGKRFRPVLALMASFQCGTRGLLALDAACALEMVHAASLILDDLPCMDDAALRRGRPTTHRQYGEDIAILAGIGLLNRAYGVLGACESISPETRLELITEISDAIGPQGLIGGQEADLRDRAALFEPAAIGQLYHAKTGLLLEKAVDIGAAVSLASDDERRALRRFAERLGLAFQTLDDLLDTPSPAPQGAMGKDTGKDTGKDLGKPTLIDLLGEAHARRQVDEWIEEACQNLQALRGGAEPLSGFVRATFAATLRQ